MADNTTKVYFPNLDGLRFLMAMFVIVIHIEALKITHGREIVPIIAFYGTNGLGNLAVSAFFVLSGFLITSILFKEQQITGIINLKNYYTRRTLRIWPLYFFTMIIGFFLFPYLESVFKFSYSSDLYPHFWVKLIAYALFLPTLIAGLSGLPETVGTSWSVRVEEVFYLFWPLLLRKTKNYVKLFLYIIVVVLAVRVGFFFVKFCFNHVYTGKGQSMFDALERTIINYRISCMAIGALGAYIVEFNKKNILNFIYRKDVQWAVYGITGLLLICNVHIPVIGFELYSVLFCFVIVNIATNPKTIVNIDYKWTNYIGRTSYGLYMYNSITRILCLELVEHIYGKNIQGWEMEITLYTLSIGSTIAVAILSYEFMEKPFLKLKNRFTTVKTGV